VTKTSILSSTMHGMHQSKRRIRVPVSEWSIVTGVVSCNDCTSHSLTGSPTADQRANVVFTAR